MGGLEPSRVAATDFYDNSVLGLGYEGLGGRQSMMLSGFVGMLQALDGRQAELLSLFNVRHVLVPTTPDHAAWKVLPNPQAYPRAWLTGRSRVLKGQEEALKALAEPAFDPRSEALLEGGEALSGPPPQGAVQWLARTPQSAALQVDSARPAVLMVSNCWYPSWRCWVDGVERPLLRADGALQGLLLPAGRHAVDLRFDPGLFYDALAASLAALLAIVGLAFIPGGPRPGAEGPAER
jgi:hypothetical protein